MQAIDGSHPPHLRTLWLCAGITAASGISAELGIPLTHRGVATSVAFITGHAREGGEDELDETVTASADKNTTLVVYMGLNTLPALLQRLKAAGLSPDTPAAAVERGTTIHQRAVYATLGELTKARSTQISTIPPLFLLTV
jgi:uroporphyrin-III C-methyltransferase